MGRSSIYAGLAVLGAVLPWAFLAAFFRESGIGPSFLYAVAANGAAAGFAVDLVLSSVVFWTWLAQDARERGRGPLWPFVLATLTIGLSCALPAWLWWRERRDAGVQ